MSHTAIIKAIRAELGPHLLRGLYKHRRPANATPSWGTCYVASEALYHLWGKANGYKPMRVKFVVEKRLKNATGTHWFLEHKVTGLQVDITADQFDGEFYGVKPNYKSARGAGFLTKKPSKRTQQVINAVRKKLQNDN